MALALALGSATAEAQQPPPLTLFDAPRQSELLLGETAPGVELFFDDRPVAVAEDGAFVIGFGRDAPAQAELRAIAPDGGETALRLEVEARDDYVVQRIDGLPPAMVTPLGEETLARIRAERALIVAVKAIDSDLPAWREPILRPADGIETGVYGSQRILNGEPRAWHRGVDIAADEGAPIWAMTAGVVTLAEPDLYFTGGTVWIDHGHGVSSVYAHMSRIDVVEGQDVARGDVIGAVGSTGRSTGPHLHWGVYWLDVPIDPNTLAYESAAQ